VTPSLPVLGRDWQPSTQWYLVGGFRIGSIMTWRLLEAAQTAIELDAGLSLAYAVIGLVYRSRPPYRWEAALENLGLAIQNDSKNTTSILWRAVAYMLLGYFESAMTDLNQCLSIDPHYGICRRFKAMLYLMHGERDAGIALYLRTLESDISGPQPMFVSAFALSGNRAAALLVADRSTQHTGAPISHWVNLIENPDLDRREALEAFDRWVKRENRDKNIYVPMAISFGAFDRITPENASYSAGIWLPEFAKFRQSSHFKRVVSERNMQAFWRSHGFPPQCRPIGDQDFECD
jgi:adenylate cyclase